MGHSGNDLTPREREVLELVKLRWADQDIADRLSVTLSAVEELVISALTKVGFKSRQESWPAAGGLKLTPREGEVLQYVRLRWRNKEIADELGISEATVETHVHNTLAKLGYRTRKEYWDDLKIG